MCPQTFKPRIYLTPATKMLTTRPQRRRWQQKRRRSNANKPKKKKFFFLDNAIGKLVSEELTIMQTSQYHTEYEHIRTRAWRKMDVCHHESTTLSIIQPVKALFILTRRSIGCYNCKNELLPCLTSITTALSCSYHLMYQTQNMNGYSNM
jgi:hypothetical protein